MQVNDMSRTFSVPLVLRFGFFAKYSSLHSKLTSEALRVVAESIERWPHMREIGSWLPVRVKQMTYKIDTCRLLDIKRIGQAG